MLLSSYRPHPAAGWFQVRAGHPPPLANSGQRAIGSVVQQVPSRHPRCRVCSNWLKHRSSVDSRRSAPDLSSWSSNNFWRCASCDRGHKQAAPARCTRLVQFCTTLGHTCSRGRRCPRICIHEFPRKLSSKSFRIWRPPEWSDRSHSRRYPKDRIDSLGHHSPNRNEPEIPVCHHRKSRRGKFCRQPWHIWKNRNYSIHNTIERNFSGNGELLFWHQLLNREKFS